VISDEKDIFLGSVILTQLNELNSTKITYDQTWQINEFRVIQGAQAKTSYGLYAACAAIVRELDILSLLDSDGQKKWSNTELPTKNEMSDGLYLTEGIDSPTFLSPKKYRRLLALAEISEIEMELYICNSDF
jgi:hypothetical protein